MCYINFRNIKNIFYRSQLLIYDEHIYINFKINNILLEKKWRSALFKFGLNLGLCLARSNQYRCL